MFSFFFGKKQKKQPPYNSQQTELKQLAQNIHKLNSYQPSFDITNNSALRNNTQLADHIANLEEEKADHNNKKGQLQTMSTLTSHEKQWLAIPISHLKTPSDLLLDIKTDCLTIETYLSSVTDSENDEHETDLLLLAEQKSRLTQLTNTFHKIFSQHLWHIISQDFYTDHACFLIKNNSKSLRYKTPGKNCQILITYLYKNDTASTIKMVEKISQDHTLYANNDIQIIPKKILQLLATINFWLKLFPTYLSWHNTFIQNDELEWELIATKHKITQNNIHKAETYYLLQKKSLEIINSKTTKLTELYYQFWPIISYFRRSIIAKYLAHYQQQKQSLMQNYQTWLAQQTIRSSFTLESIQAINNIQTMMQNEGLQLSANDQTNIATIYENQQQKLIKKLFSGLLSSGAIAEETFLETAKINEYLNTNSPNMLSKNIADIFLWLEDKQTKSSIEDTINNILNKYDFNFTLTQLQSESLMQNIVQSLYMRRNSNNQLVSINTNTPLVNTHFLLSQPYWYQTELNQAPLIINDNFNIANWLNYSTKLAIQKYLSAVINDNQLCLIASQCKEKRPMLFDLLKGTFLQQGLNLLKTKIVNNNINKNIVNICKLIYQNTSAEDEIIITDTIISLIKRYIFSRPWQQQSARLILFLDVNCYHSYMRIGLQQSLAATNDDFMHYYLAHQNSTINLFGLSHQERSATFNILTSSINQQLYYQKDINLSLLIILLKNKNFWQLYLKNHHNKDNLVKQINLLILSKNHLQKIDDLQMTDSLQAWQNLLIKCANLIAKTQSSNHSSSNAFIQKIFTLCSEKWRQWIMTDMMTTVVVKLTHLENLLSNFKNNEIFIPLRQIFKPWDIICKYRSYISTSSDNMLDTIRQNDFDFLDKHGLYHAILQLKIYPQYIYHGLFAHLNYLKITQPSILNSANIQQLEKTLNDNNHSPPYWLYDQSLTEPTIPNLANIEETTNSM